MKKTASEEQEIGAEEKIDWRKIKILKQPTKKSFALTEGEKQWIKDFIAWRKRSAESLKNWVLGEPRID